MRFAIDRLTSGRSANPMSFSTFFRQEPWREQALCAQTDPEAFFPDKGGSGRGAKAMCLRCDVSAECLESALSRDERFGIWGGFSERERRKIQKRRHAEPEPA